MPEAHDARPDRPLPPPPDATQALFLDVDGVLLGFAPAPDRVAVPPALRVRLQALHDGLGGALALVSGRAVADLDRLFAPLRLPCAGLHGLERRAGPGGAVESAGGAPAAALAEVVEGARRIAARYPGVVVEDKGAAIALHWRAEPLAASDLQAYAAAALGTLPDYHLQPGNQVVELKPRGADKGSAIAAFLEQPPFAGRTPVFLGDDLTVEHGFEWVNLHGGRSVLVGMREPSAAAFGLADIAAVHRWLGVEADGGVAA